MPFSRTVHTSLPRVEIADRLAIRELLDAYAHCADRRGVEGQLSLFTTDMEFLLAAVRGGGGLRLLALRKWGGML